MLALLLAVTLTELPYDRTQRADYFVTDRKLKVDTKRIERFLVKTEALLDTHVPRFRFTRVARSGEVDFGCYGHLQPEESAGMVCAGRTRAYSTHTDHDEHEVVHLVWGAAFPGEKHAGPFWEEGFARLIGHRDADQRRAKFIVRKMGSLNAVHAGAPRDRWYNASAAFQQWLVKRHGMGKLMAFFKLCATERNIDKAFEATFKTPRAAAETLWLYGKKGPPAPKPRQK